MNKADLRGIDKVIKEENAIIKICMDKRLVRKMIINKEEGKDVVYTAGSLKKLLRSASKQLTSKEKQNQVCVGGIPTFDSNLDEILKDFYFVIFKDQEQELFKMHINGNENNRLLLKCEAPFKDGIYGLIDVAENFLEKDNEKQNNF